MYDRQTFLGPPENVRDHMTAACRALATGDWKKSYGYVSALPCWNLLGQSKDVVLGLLKTKFQEEGLRAYLLAHAKFYTSLSMEQLCNMFELSERRAHAIVSGMIANESLAGSFDQPTNTVVMLHEEATRLQKLASQFADKASVLVDFNERALAMRTGVLITDDDEDSSRKGPDSGGRRTRMGGRIPGGRGRGRGRRFDRAGGFVADAGFSGGVFGKGRNNSRGAHVSITDPTVDIHRPRHLFGALLLPHELHTLLGVLLHRHGRAVRHVVQSVVCSVIQRLADLILPCIVWDLVVSLQAVR